MKDSVLSWLGSLDFSLESLKLLVLVEQDELEEVATESGNDEHGENDSVGDSVTIGLELPDIRTADVTGLRESVDHGEGDGSLGGRSGE